jgi:transcriptional regulator with XRE-family HTH domain
MATTLAPVDSREVVRCDFCHMVQFRTNNGLCRRCHKSLDREDPPIIEAPPETQPIGRMHSPALQVAGAIRSLRQKAGLSQRQLAQRMNVPRTYVSKIENEKATPTLASLERLARALEVPVPELLNGGNGEGTSASELLADKFVAELVPYLNQLNPLQWQSVLAQMRDMTLHTRRSA